MRIFQKVTRLIVSLLLLFMLTLSQANDDLIRALENYLLVLKGVIDLDYLSPEEIKEVQWVNESLRKQQSTERKRLPSNQELRSDQEKLLEAVLKTQQELAQHKKTLEQQRAALEEQKRLADEIEKKRQQNEILIRQQKELEAERLRVAEEKRLQREAYNEFQKFVPKIREKVINSWMEPEIIGNLETLVIVEIDRSGEVKSVNVARTSGSVVFDRSVTIAIQKASPLPIPKDPKFFRYIRKFQFLFVPSG